MQTENKHVAPRPPPKTLKRSHWQRFLLKPLSSGQQAALPAPKANTSFIVTQGVLPSGRGGAGGGQGVTVSAEWSQCGDEQC